MKNYFRKMKLPQNYYFIYETNVKIAIFTQHLYLEPVERIGS